jgi:hypothetical protein
LADPTSTNLTAGRIQRLDVISFIAMCLGWLCCVVHLSQLSFGSKPKFLPIGLPEDTLQNLRKKFTDVLWMPPMASEPWLLPDNLNIEQDVLLSMWKRSDWEGITWNLTEKDLTGVEVKVLPFLNQLIVRGTEGAHESLPKYEPRLFDLRDHLGQTLGLKSNGNTFALNLSELQHRLELKTSFESLPKTLLQAIEQHGLHSPHMLTLSSGNGGGEYKWLFHDSSDENLKKAPLGLPRFVQTSARLPYFQFHGGLDWPFDSSIEYGFVSGLGQTLLSRQGLPLIIQSVDRQFDFAWHQPPLLSEKNYSLLLEAMFPRPHLKLTGLKDLSFEELERGGVKHRQQTIFEIVLWMLMAMSWSLAVWRRTKVIKT